MILPIKIVKMSIKDKMDRVKRAITGESAEDDNTGIVAQVSDATTLSWSTRIKGFVICFAIGCVLSIMSTFFLFIPGAGLTIFAIFYTIGNICALASTCFLMGPCNQLKRMFALTRLIATILVLVFMALTLCAALWWKITGLAIVFCILQFFALLWYGISYIPYARDAVKKCGESCLT